MSIKLLSLEYKIRRTENFTLVVTCSCLIAVSAFSLVRNSTKAYPNERDCTGPSFTRPMVTERTGTTASNSSRRVSSVVAKFKFLTNRVLPSSSTLIADRTLLLSTIGSTFASQLCRMEGGEQKIGNGNKLTLTSGKKNIDRSPLKIYGHMMKSRVCQTLESSASI